MLPPTTHSGGRHKAHGIAILHQWTNYMVLTLMRLLRIYLPVTDGGVRVKRGMCPIV